MQITPTVYMHQSSLIPRPQHTAAVKLGLPGNEPALMFVEGKSDTPALLDTILGRDLLNNIMLYRNSKPSTIPDVYLIK